MNEKDINIIIEREYAAAEATMEMQEKEDEMRSKRRRHVMMLQVTSRKCNEFTLAMNVNYDNSLLFQFSREIAVPF